MPSTVLTVLSNDLQGNGYSGPRLITAVGLAADGGTVTIRADGKAIIYSAAAGYTGGDSFTYQVDGELRRHLSAARRRCDQSALGRVFPRNGR
jgi:hypothetical protein